MRKRSPNFYFGVNYPFNPPTLQWNVDHDPDQIISVVHPHAHPSFPLIFLWFTSVCCANSDHLALLISLFTDSQCVYWSCNECMFRNRDVNVQYWITDRLLRENVSKSAECRMLCSHTWIKWSCEYYILIVSVERNEIS